MRKNKKLFAILTLVAFMMTLMPVLAFGAELSPVALSGTAAAEKLSLTTTGDVYKVTLDGTTIKAVGTKLAAKEIALADLTVNDTYIAINAGDAAPVANTDTIDAATNVLKITSTHISEVKALTTTSFSSSKPAATYSATGLTFASVTGHDIYLVTEDTGANVGKVASGTKVTGLIATANLAKNQKYAAYPTGYKIAGADMPAASAVYEIAQSDLDAIAALASSAADNAAAAAYMADPTGVAAYAGDKTVANLNAVVTGWNDLSDSVKAIVNSKKATDMTAANSAALDMALANKKAVDAVTAAGDGTSMTETQMNAAIAADTKALRDAIADDSTALGNLDEVQTAKTIVAAWDAFVANPTDETLVAYQAKDTANAAFSNIVNKRSAAEKSAATKVAVPGTTLAVAKKVLEDNKVTGGGSGSIVTPPVQGTTSADASIIATKDASASCESVGTAGVSGGVLVDTNSNNDPLIDTKYVDLDLVFKTAGGGNAPAQNVYVWAEERSNQPSDAFVLNKGTTVGTTNVYKINAGDLVGGSNNLRAAFKRGGTYTLKAAFAPGVDITAATDVKDLAIFKGANSKTTVTVTAPAQNTRAFMLTVGSGVDGNGNDRTTNISAGLADGGITPDATPIIVAADTVATTKVSLVVYGPAKNGSRSLMTTYPIRLSTNSANIELDETSVTTDYNGKATFNVAGLREGNYKIYVNIGDYEATLRVQVGATSANDIQLIKFPSNPIATDTLVTDYKDVFRFQLTDANGNIVNQVTPNGAKYAMIQGTDKDTAEQAKYASIVKAPEANKVKNADLTLVKVPGKDYYTLYVGSNKAFTAEGDYEIRVVLDNGKSATLTFSVKKFDKAVSLHIEYPTQAVELNSETETPDIYFLDANRVMKKANNRVTVAAQGYAVASVEESGSDAGKLWIKNDEKYVGQTITVTAASDKENLMASTTLTVADQAREVKLDTNRGPVNANNRVGFKVVDSTGHAVALGKDATVEVTAVVTNTGDQDAKVSYSVTGSSRAELQEKGTGVINLSANKQTTATVQIMVKVTKNNKTNANDNNTGLSTTYYSGTETFTFGAEADKSVVMTIGSKEIVAQNVPVTIDVAPFIQDNRTYVPFRALVEAFGAEVDYNADNNTVTTKLDGKTVVLTVGSTVLTVNDETVTMDVAPFIVDDRVVVPVRFVGEAFGFTVEATQDADTGATASVVFYQK